MQVTDTNLFRDGIKYDREKVLQRPQETEVKQREVVCQIEPKNILV